MCKKKVIEISCLEEYIEAIYSIKDNARLIVIEQDW